MIHMCSRTHVCTHIHTCTQVYAHVCTHIYVCMHMHMCTHTGTQTLIHNTFNLIGLERETSDFINTLKKNRNRHFDFPSESNHLKNMNNNRSKWDCPKSKDQDQNWGIWIQSHSLAEILSCRTQHSRETRGEFKSNQRVCEFIRWTLTFSEGLSAWSCLSLLSSFGGYNPDDRGSVRQPIIPLRLHAE